jgi:hypothetical protein
MPERKTPTGVTNETRQWLASAVLSATVLEPLHELNRRWLAVLASTPRLWTAHAASPRLPDPVGAGLLALTPEQCVAIGRCPFSLFTASFNDGVYWRGIAGNTAVHEPEPAASEGAARDALMSFAELALFYAWHLARVNPAAARIVLGMTDQTLGVFGTLTLTTLQRLAMTNPGLFAPRWPERSAFWMRLLDAHPDPAAADVRLLGLQMMAAELSTLRP